MVLFVAHTLPVMAADDPQNKYVTGLGQTWRQLDQQINSRTYWVCVVLWLCRNAGREQSYCERKCMSKSHGDRLSHGWLTLQAVGSPVVCTDADYVSSEI